MQSWIPFIPESASTLSDDVDAVYFYISGVTVFFVTLISLVIIFFVIQTFVAQPYQIRQQSMETTLEPDQYVLVDKLTHRFDTYKRGDIVVFNPPVAWQ